MSSRTKGCANDPNNFCYKCGSFVAKAQRQNVIRFVENVYSAYFGIKLGDWDEAQAPHKVCCICVESLHQWSNGSKNL